MGSKRVDERRMDDMRVKVGVEEGEEMEDEKLAKRADTQKVEGKCGEEDRNCDGRLH